MKYILASVLGTGLLVANALGQARVEPRPYVRGDVGVAITEDADASFFPGAGSVTMEFDPGMRFSVAGGAMFGDYLALELETGWIFNDIESISGFNDVDAWLTQVPLLMNARFEFRNNTGLTPFIGAGVGGSILAINIDEATSSTVRVDGEEADMVFAWQGFAGLKYELNENLSVGIIYKYFWSDDGRWDVDDTSQDIRFDGTRTHSISAVVSYSF